MNDLNTRNMDVTLLTDMELLDLMTEKPDPKLMAEADELYKSDKLEDMTRLGEINDWLENLIQLKYAAFEEIGRRLTK